MTWLPHITVAAIVFKDGQYLMVQEREDDGSLVYNQPAGHLEANESLIDALHRETFEETGWRVKATAILSMNLFTSPRNNTTYFRCNFIAEAVNLDQNASIDSDIENIVWMSEQEIQSQRDKMRSPLVINAINDFKSGQHYPLSMLKNLSSTNATIANES